MKEISYAFERIELLRQRIETLEKRLNNHMEFHVEHIRIE